jgi:subtilisin family serine protease
MKALNNTPCLESLEVRRLLSWSAYAKLVEQDVAASDFSSITGKGVTVAVIDTGIDYNLASLGGGIGTNFKVRGGYDFQDNDADPMDTVGHGTAVAGVIAAKPYTVGGITYQGVAPDARLVALRVGNESGISDSNIEQALQWVITNHKTYGISVVNLSLGSGNYTDPQSNPTMSDEFQKLHDLGIFVVAASGNSNDQNSGPISQDGIAFPSADPNVFAVGAVDSSNVIPSWAQRGQELDLLAPGVQIVMPKLGGGTVTEDGTSFASPYVAGTAALIKQKDASVQAGDIGSILMSSGKNNRDGDAETGNTTGLQFSRLDIEQALKLTSVRQGKFETFDLGKTFDTALDSNGVLHAAYYDGASGNLMYLTRSTSGLWSNAQIVDSAGDVGGQLSIAVDSTAKTGIGYFDVTNTSLKFADFTGRSFATATIDSKKNVGTSPSVGFDIDGNAYLAYYKKSGGYLKLATLDRDQVSWSTQIVDGGSKAKTGATVSLDVGEAALRSGGFTFFDTTVAMAYSDSTNGDLKYARLDVDASSPSWYVAVVDDLDGVANIDLNLHAGPLNSGLQAQIAYQDTYRADVKYAFRKDTWFTETVAGSGRLGDRVQLSFDSSNDPQVTFYNRTKRSLYMSVRDSDGDWSGASRVGAASGPVSVSVNERTSEQLITWLNRPQTEVSTSELV